MNGSPGGNDTISARYLAFPEVQLSSRDHGNLLGRFLEVGSARCELAAGFISSLETPIWAAEIPGWTTSM